VGQRLRTEVLGDARASYGAKLLDQLGQQLAQEFGRGFESRSLRRMVKFAEGFPDAAIVSTLSAKLSWSHMAAIVALKTPQAREFYASQAAQDGWSVRELQHQVERKPIERTGLAKLVRNWGQIPIKFTKSSRQMKRRRRGRGRSLRPASTSAWDLVGEYLLVGFVK
jgi:DUF1016 N-terminal domain